MARVTEIAREHDVILTHGNAPQVGLPLQASRYTDVPPYPLDVFGAESEGMIGYVLEQELENRAARAKRRNCPHPDRGRPERPRLQDTDEADRCRLQRGGRTTARTRAELDDSLRQPTTSGGSSPRPRPLRIVELAAIRTLVESGALVIC